MWATNLKVAAVVIGTLAFYTLLANSIPQLQSEVPQQLTLGADVTPEQLVAAGEQLYNGAGGCTACHGLGTRAPNLLTDERGTGLIGARCETREPGKDCKEYLHEALVKPGAFVAPGYEPIMPDMSRTLSGQQIWALVAFLQKLPEMSPEEYLRLTQQEMGPSAGADAMQASPSAEQGAADEGAGSMDHGAHAGH